MSELSRVSEDVRQLIDDIADQDGEMNERRHGHVSQEFEARATTAYTTMGPRRHGRVRPQKTSSHDDVFGELEEEHIVLLGDVQEL